MNTVHNEISTLKKVIVHRPDDGIEVITPANALKFLYDDIVFLPLMRKEHDTFTDIITHFLGKNNVVDSFQLLLDNIKENKDNNKQKLIDYVIDLENCEDDVVELLHHLSDEELAYTLFTGIDKKSGELVLPPLPNYVFTRDIGVVVNDHIIICNASKKARTRESILTRYIIYYHPEFAAFQQNNDAKIVDMTKKCDECTIEGGDIMLLGDKHLLVGCSERSTPEAFESLKETLFEKNAIEHLVRIVIAKDRSSMHIDTLFTQISTHEYVIYEDTLKSDIIKVTKYYKDGRKKEFSTLEEFFLDYDPEMRFILCGNGNDTFAAREQWTDACNLVALKDGVAISYYRNLETAKALEKAGYTIIRADEFLAQAPNPDTVEKTIIAIASTELSRARGGPHCMTFPIWRE